MLKVFIRISLENYQATKNSINNIKLMKTFIKLFMQNSSEKNSIQVFCYSIKGLSLKKLFIDNSTRLVIV